MMKFLEDDKFETRLEENCNIIAMSIMIGCTDEEQKRRMKRLNDVLNRKLEYWRGKVYEGDEAVAMATLSVLLKTMSDEMGDTNEE